MAEQIFISGVPVLRQDYDAVQKIVSGKFEALFNPKNPRADASAGAGCIGVEEGRVRALDLSTGIYGLGKNKIGDLDFLRFLSALSSLRIANREYTEVPIEVFELPNLKYLDLLDNKLSALSPRVGNLRSLRTLSLDRNVLNTLPSEIQKLECLKMLNLADNPVKTLPVEAIEALYKNGCQITLSRDVEFDKETDSLIKRLAGTRYERYGYGNLGAFICLKK